MSNQMLLFILLKSLILIQCIFIEFSCARFRGKEDSLWPQEAHSLVKETDKPFFKSQAF